MFAASLTVALPRTLLFAVGRSARLRAWAARLMPAFLVAVGACQASASPRECDPPPGSTGSRFACCWQMTDSKHFETLMFVEGYARVHMHDRAVEVASALSEEELGLDDVADLEYVLGRSHYWQGHLEKALLHFRNAAESGRFPACTRAGIWRHLAAVSAELGRYDEAARYGERWREDHEAPRLSHKEGPNPLRPGHLLLLAKYWSHVDPRRALEYAESALAVASVDDPPVVLDEAAMRWIVRLRAGEAAPAAVPPLDRPWLRQSAEQLAEAALQYRLKIERQHRKYVARPSAQPSTPRAGADQSGVWRESSWTVEEFALPHASAAPRTLRHVDLVRPKLPKPAAKAADDVAEAGSSDGA